MQRWWASKLRQYLVAIAFCLMKGRRYATRVRVAGKPRAYVIVCPLRCRNMGAGTSNRARPGTRGARGCIQCANRWDCHSGGPCRSSWCADRPSHFTVSPGVWVGQHSPIPNTHGFRNDLIAVLCGLHVPVVRWPGGCFPRAAFVCSPEHFA